ncbi:MAG: tRNA 2-thiouridine(34) synthase MnmA [Planctomycetota bacterium]|jgi:tRNA-specific 2-thiouridylase
MSRVLVAMSGGVDSSVAALLLQDAGHEVVGAFMRNGVSGDGPARAKTCCSASDARDAAAVADRLGVPIYAIDYAAEFGRLIDHFAAEYRRGRTPNPCVLCNQDLKFGHLFSLAEAVGADAVATGHYARITAGQLCRARDPQKDQTYYLFGVDRAALARVHFPLGDLTKAEVRRRAAAAGLVTAEKPESMEICFVTSGDYRDVVRDRGGTGKAGVFLDVRGNVVGEHQGVAGFTVGQRRGLPALGKPHYVQEIRPDTGAVVLCERDGLLQDTALLRGINWLVDPPVSPPGELSGTVAAEVKVRAGSAATPARITVQSQDPSVARVRFDPEVHAVTPGQAAVFYRGDLVLGGGWID